MKTTEHASPCIEKYVIQSLFMMGQGDYGLECMRRRYALMVNDPVYTTLYESWDMGKGDMPTSCNHAWSGGGGILSAYVCGVIPLEAGYGKWQVAPCSAGIRKASTVVPAVKGPLTASFVVTDDAITITVKAPRGLSGELVVPRGYEHEGQVIAARGIYL